MCNTRVFDDAQVSLVNADSAAANSALFAIKARIRDHG
jgi:hypothetical protein